jgi:hypothetical protein
MHLEKFLFNFKNCLSIFKKIIKERIQEANLINFIYFFYFISNLYIPNLPLNYSKNLSISSYWLLIHFIFLMFLKQNL